IFMTIPLAILAIILAIGYLSENWDKIKAKTLEIWNAISRFLDDKLDWMRGIMEAAWTDMRAKLQFAWDTMKNYIDTALNVIRDVINIVMALLKGDWQAAWDGVKQLVSDVWDGIKTQIDISIALILGVLSGFPALAVDALGDLLGLLVQKGLDLIQGLLNGIVWLFEMEVKAYLRIGQKVLDAVGDLGSLLYDKGKSLIQGLWDGIKALWGEVEGWVSDAVGDLIPSAGDVLGKFNPLNWAEGGVIPGAAGGGLFNGLSGVGEKGPELMALPGGTRIYSNADSMKMVGKGRGGVIVNIGHVDARSEDEARAAASGMGYALQQAMRSRGVAA
ncbi:MAG: hypothetical protein MUP14_07400, partial [Dehalococcoidia bacterium]|nr:hypothetical protein [Dehalococcoidia bacterium]